MNFYRAWDKQNGWTLISVIDSGIQESHPEFVAIDASGTFAGGNFIKELSRTFAGSGTTSPPPGWFRNVDELDMNDNCAGGPILFGHGTHIAGLMSAKIDSNDVTGTCPTCALVVAKTRRCIGGSAAIPLTAVDPEVALTDALTYLTDQGVSVINRSGGQDRIDSFDAKYSSLWCHEGGSLVATCLALLTAHENEVAVVASAGNRLGGSIQWPAADPYVFAIGGLELNIGPLAVGTAPARLWQQTNNDESFCPSREVTQPPNVPAPYPTLAGPYNPPFTPPPPWVLTYRECGTSARWATSFIPAGTFGSGIGPPILNSYPNDRMTEFLAPARYLRSAIYTGANWIARKPFNATQTAPGFPYHNACSDDSDAPANCVGQNCFDSYGNCSGTSMSAPIISGLIGLMRSTIPLARLGVTDRPTYAGVGGPPVRMAPTHLRKAMADGASVPPSQIPVVMPPQLPQPMLSEVVGFGYPNAELVLNTLLGVSSGIPVRNRVSPMYTMYTDLRIDIAQTANPHQFMKWRSLFGFNKPLPMTTAIAVSAHWWGVDGSFENTLRRAAFYVFTTDVLPKSTWKEGFEMRPVFHIGKPLTAVPVSPADYEHQLAVGTIDLNNQLGTGYRLLGRQGFVPFSFQNKGRCSDVGLKDLVRICRTQAPIDCLLLPHGHAVPSGYLEQGVTLGCVVEAVDSDGDGLPDAFETILGTNPHSAHSDADSCPDGVEYPLNAVPKSDPLVSSIGCP